MSSKLGPLTWGKRQQLTFLGVEGQEERNYSEETARIIDSEVKQLVEEARQRATAILTAKRALLDRLAAELEKKEMLSGEEVDEIIQADEPAAGEKSAKTD